MKGKYIFFILLLVITSCGSGGGGSDSTITPPVPPAPPSPTHPAVWDKVLPESVGMDSVKLEEAFAYALQDGSFTQAVVVIKDGKLVSESYRGISSNESNSLAESVSLDASSLNALYGQRDVESYISSWSTAKSFTSILIGLAVDAGYISSIEDSASTFITEWSNDERS
jgi:CubicO group peptidase (beta-lactamase class C family)